MVSFCPDGKTEVWHTPSVETCVLQEVWMNSCFALKVRVVWDATCGLIGGIDAGMVVVRVLAWIVEFCAWKHAHAAMEEAAEGNVDLASVVYLRDWGIVRGPEACKLNVPEMSSLNGSRLWIPSSHLWSIIAELSICFSRGRNVEGLRFACRRICRWLDFACHYYGDKGRQDEGIHA